MCLMLYMATDGDQPLRESPDLRVEEIEDSRATVRRWFSLPTVRFIGAHTGCSCGFPSVIADQPVDYFDGMFNDDEERQADLNSVRSLLALIQEHVRAAGEVQLYPVSDGDEASPPKGTIDISFEAFDPATFFFNEQFLYRVTGKPGSSARSAYSAVFTLPFYSASILA